MNRLRIRIVLSHLLVVFVGVTVAYLVVRQLAPSLFVEGYGSGGMGGGQGGPPNSGPGQGPAQGGGVGLRDTVEAAVNTAVLVGGSVGVVLAGLLGVLLARRLSRPLELVQVTTRRIASGDYSAHVEPPRDKDFAGLVDDVNHLAGELAQTEGRRLRLLSEVAHEMRTPLTVLEGYVEGMVDGVIPAGLDELAEMGVELRRLNRLADDLSALSRAEEGRLDVTAVPGDLSAVVRQAAGRLEPQATDAGLTLTIDADDAVAARFDADRVAQVVTNLVGNAIRATAPGGRIEVRTGRAGSRVWVRVADTGEGLAAADLERIFERFYRVPGRRQTPGESGSGIGLTMSRQLMRAQGGDLTAASGGIGQGATFEAWLPA